MSDLDSVLTPRSARYHSVAARNAKHWLYRIYDADGVLLYIGCTNNVKRRIDAHKRGGGGAVASQWIAACMSTFEVEGPWRTRDAAREAEADAIRHERPVFNTQSGRKPHATVRNRVARYLLAHGHVELAEATACTCWTEHREAGAVAEWCAAHTEQVEPRRSA